MHEGLLSTRSMTEANWSHEETDDPLYDDRRNLSGTYRAICLHDCYSYAKGHVVLSLASLKTFPSRAQWRGSWSSCRG